jgi:hypothetical protein
MALVCLIVMKIPSMTTWGIAWTTRNVPIRIKVLMRHCSTFWQICTVSLAGRPAKDKTAPATEALTVARQEVVRAAAQETKTGHLLTEAKHNRLKTVMETDEVWNNVHERNCRRGW